MAAGTFTIYTTALKHLLEDSIELGSHAIVAVPLHSGYTPGTASHSALAQISGFQSTASATVVNSITLANVTVTGSGAVFVKVDADDISGFSAGGDTFACKYIALYAQSAGAGSSDLLLGFMDTNTGATTGVESTQLNVTWPAGGIFKLNGNS